MKDQSLLEGNENYWKQRCEAAERVYTTHLRDSNSDAAENAFAAWMEYFKTPPPPASILPEGDRDEFLKYVSEAREDFSAFILSLPFDNALRTKVDDILICFDQMAERLKK